MPERPIRIESGANSDGLRIYIRDDASGVMLAGFTLTTQQTWDLLRGGSLRDVGAIMTDHFDRVGKTMQNETVMYTRDQLRASEYSQAETDAAEMARADRPGWDAYEPRRRGGGSGGVEVVLRRWV